MNLVRARDVIGLPVVSIDSGEALAEVRDVVYDGEAHRLLGFTLNKRGRFAGRMKAVLPAGAVAAIGRDAVMVDAESAIDGTDDRREDSSLPGELGDLGAARPVIGNRVLTAEGSELGEIVAVVLAIGDEPQAVGYELRASGRTESSFVPISAQIALSGENLVLPAEATPFVRDDMASFGDAIASNRSAALGEER